MARLCTRVKRAHGLKTSRLHVFRNIVGKNGARTFTTEDKAKEYALNTMKLSEGSFSIESAKRNKRFKIVQ